MPYQTKMPAPLVVPELCRQRAFSPSITITSSSSKLNAHSVATQWPPNVAPVSFRTFEEWYRQNVDNMAEAGRITPREAEEHMDQMADEWLSLCIARATDES